MNLIVRDLHHKYCSVELHHDAMKIDLGLHDDKERKELVKSLIECAHSASLSSQEFLDIVSECGID